VENDKLKLLTISIAAYNVENYLEKCLSSLNDERFKKDIEVLIIDDGSKDNTKKIAEEFQKESPDTFHYIPKKNGGHGSTINKGIELASGRYFRVIDGDDWVNSDKFNMFIQNLKKTNSDMVLNQHIEISPIQKKLISFVHNMKEGKEYEISESLGIEKVTLHMLTVKSKLLKKNNVKITENCFYVDVEYVIWAIYFSKTVTFFGNSLYMYRVGNVSQSVNKKNMLKNVSMQERVSLKLVSLYVEFSKSGLLSQSKDKMIFNTIEKSIGSTFRTYLLLPDSSDSREKILQFDSRIQSLSTNVYKRLGKGLFISAVRIHNYLLLPVIGSMYRLWCLKYEV
jgi:glycosyltransferase involved in cell wall biosynthesis